MVPFRGRLHFRQYIPNKTHKYGIKLYKLCSPEGYTFNVSVYTGKGDTKADLGHSQSIVMKLLECVKTRTDKMLFADNFYSSVPLVTKLLEEKIMYCGTLRSNRKGIPPSLNIKKKMKRGEIFGMRRNGVKIIKWMDKRLVLMITSVPTHNSNLVATGKKNRKGQDILKPKCVIDYNNAKKGVDYSDQMSSYHTVLRRSMKWYRSCTILCGSAVVLMVLAIIFALVGHCNNDSKTIIACGLFISGGLSLGSALVVFVSSLSATLMEILQYHKEPPTGPLYDYRYGWCFFAAGVAFIMTNMAALFTISGYLNRFSSVDEMVRQMVPGAERKLLEHQHLSTEYLVHHAGPSSLSYDPIPSDRPKYDTECGAILNKTPPDVCTTNKCSEFCLEDIDQACMMSSVVESSYSVAQTLAGQTIPITIKNHNSTAPLSFSNLPMKYGTMHYDHPGSVQCTSTLHQGFLGVSDLGSSSSTSSSGYCGRSKTLQHQKNKKKCGKIETFQVPETSLTDFGKRTNEFSFSGSAV